MYTNIPQDKLFMVGNELIGFCFKGGNGRFIYPTSHGAKWVKERGSSIAVFPKSYLNWAVNCFLQNRYFNLQNMMLGKIQEFQ